MSLLLPAFEVVGSPHPGWEALRLVFASVFHLETHWALVAGIAANVLYANALVGGWIFFSKPGCQWAALGGLAAALLARAITFDPAKNWHAEGFLIGYWVWLGSMLATSAGYYLLAMSFGARQPLFADDDSRT